MMRAGSVLSEAGRNLVANTSRTALLAAIFVLLVGSIAVIDLRAIVSVLRDAEQYRSSGAAVQVIESIDNISGDRCDAMGAAGSIRGSGALRSTTAIRALALPSSDLTVWEASPGFAALLPQLAPMVGDPRGAGVWLSADLAETLGVGAGDTLQTSTGSIDIAAIYEWAEDGRARDLAYAVVAPVAPGGVFDRCWQQVWPDDENAASLLLTAVNGSANSGLSRLNSSFGDGFDAPARIAQRATIAAPFGSAVAGLLLGVAAIRARRLELAAVLHARVSRPALLVQQLVEASTWVTAGSLLSIAAVVVAAAIDNPDVGAATWQIGVRTVVVAAASALIGTLAATALVREKHLFRYFKDR